MAGGIAATDRSVARRNRFRAGPRRWLVRVVLVGTGVQPIPPTGYGGVERTIAEFARALAAAGHEPVVLNDVRRGRSSDEYRFALGLPARVRALHGDVVHASTPVVANRLALARLPFVYTTHSRHWFDASGLGGRWGRWLEVRAVRRARRVVALTPRLRDRIGELAGAAASARTSVIPLGVDGTVFRPAWERRRGSCALGVGVVRPFKRWELAARALRDTGWQLTIIGPTPDAAYADQLRRIGPHVTLAGERPEPELLAAYAESDLLVHPSRVELLAGVVLQGLAAGLPVLGAEAVADLIAPGCGGAAPAGAPEAAVEEFLRDAAIAYTRDPARLRRDGEAARAVALDRYAWSRVVEAHLALYRDAAAAEAATR